MTTHKEKIEIEVDVPDGYRCVGFGKPKVGQFFVYEPTNSVTEVHTDFEKNTVMILEPLPEPYVFPEWMPEGARIEYWKSIWWLVVETHSLPLTGFPSFTPPTWEQYGKGSLLVTHKK